MAAEVVGVSRHLSTIAAARRRRAIDRGSTELTCIRGADCLILAAPVSVIMDRASEIARYVDTQCVVTDTGSTKKEIVARLGRHFPRFVGAHPMAGSHKRGIAEARSDLFTGSLCILTPTARTDEKALTSVRRLWEALGARTLSLSPSRHDAIISRVSHLPHAAAFSLMNSIPAECFPYAAGGCRDTTRIAASDEEIWWDIFLSNKAEILTSLSVFKENLQKLESAVRRNDRRALTSFLKKAKLKRERLG